MSLHYASERRRSWTVSSERATFAYSHPADFRYNALLIQLF